MKKSSLIPLFIFCSFCIGCTPEKKNEYKKTESLTANLKDENPPVMIPSGQGIIRLRIVDGKGKINIQKKKNQLINLEFESKGNKNISAKISTKDTLANIRFTQIILPNGLQDGPFSRELVYSTPIDGIYRLLIGENMMAGDPWGGILEVEVHLSK